MADSLAEAVPDEALSDEFRALRDRAHELVRRAGLMRLDGGSEPEMAAAEEGAQEAEQAAFERLQQDRDRHFGIRRQQAADDRERERLAEQQEATLRRVLLALRDRGPLTGVQLEALRIRGASHNLLRPILNVGVERGLVRRVRDGRRVLWSAVAIWEQPEITTG